jgi:hypothetical protein
MNPVFFTLFFKDFFFSTSSPLVLIHLFFAFMILHPVSGLSSSSSLFSCSFILGLLIPTCFPIAFGLSSIVRDFTPAFVTCILRALIYHSIILIANAEVA